MIKVALWGESHTELAQARRDITVLASDVAELQIEVFNDIAILEQSFFHFDMVIIEDKQFYNVLPRLQALMTDDSIEKRKGQRVLLTNLRMPADISQINAWMEHMNLENGNLTVPIPGGQRTERLNDIIYFEHKNRKIYVHTKAGAYLSSLSLKKAKELVSGRDFTVPYVSYVLNLHWIARIKGRDIILNNNEAIPLSQKKAAQVRKEYRAFLSKSQ